MDTSQLDGGFVKVQTENVYTGERKTAVTAFFSFVALDDSGKPSKVPTVIPETDEQKVASRHRTNPL